MNTNNKEPKKKRKKKEQSRGWRSFAWYSLILLLVLAIFVTFVNTSTAPREMAFSDFLNKVEKGQVEKVSVRTAEKIMVATFANGQKYKIYYLEYPQVVDILRKANVELKIDPTNTGKWFSIFIQTILPFVLIGFLWFFIFRQAQGASNQALSFGKSRAKPWDKKKDKITFKDVAGIDEAVEEVQEIVEFLKNPEKFQSLGAKIPKGALLMGPPGTGKTLLARAIAGEADVAFFSLSGSEFVEMFVGVGASRVRDLFNQAKKNMPCIIFVDEIDAVGRHRGAGLGGGHDEREQTLNQLLAEMDGFDQKTTVIVVAATNRPDILDPALLRPGRFDRHIIVDKPDVRGREAILKIHVKDKKISKEIVLNVIARRTSGFTGADLANLVNEATLLAARRDKKEVTMSELEEAIDRVIAGPQRKSRIISEKEKKIVAYHEVGHAIVAKKLPNTDPVHKVSILPRGMALGYTLQLPLEDKYLVSKEEFLDQIKIMMAGRVAEKLIFNEITSGAENDIKRATELVRKMVCEYGMSKLGPRAYGKKRENVFLGRDFSDHSKDYSDETADEIDHTMNAIIIGCYDDAKKILEENKDKLDLMSQLLIEKETIEGEELDRLLNGNGVDKEKNSEPQKTIS